MKVFTCKTFVGYWPVGTAAVVTAESHELAKILLETELARIGLPQKLDMNDIVPLPTSSRYVRILCDGNY